MIGCTLCSFNSGKDYLNLFHICYFSSRLARALQPLDGNVYIRTACSVPAQGVGQIERIDSQNIGGSACDFYIVRIRANSITLMVPVKNASNVGLRTLVSTKEAEHIWEALRNNPQQTVHTGQNWNRRFREYSERLKSPDLSIVANVLRELLLIGRTKDLSFGERRLLEQAMSLVTGELGEVLKTEQRDLQSELISLYSPPAKQPATTAH